MAAVALALVAVVLDGDGVGDGNDVDDSIGDGDSDIVMWFDSHLFFLDISTHISRECFKSKEHTWWWVQTRSVVIVVASRTLMLMRGLGPTPPLW